MEQMDMENEQRETYVPNWLLEVLAWIKRTEMADSALSTSSRTFYQLCWHRLHGNVKMREGGLYLDIRHERDELTGGTTPAISGKNFKAIPIASIPPPDYVPDINTLRIRYLDAQVLQFLENSISLIKDAGLLFSLDIQGWAKDDPRVPQIQRLLTILSSKTYGIQFLKFNNQFEHFVGLFPGFIDHLQCLQFNDEPTENLLNILLDWLKKPGPQFGKQKILDINDENTDFIEQVKKEFSAATQPLIYAICVCSDIREFTIKNRKTREVLTFYHRWDAQNNYTWKYLCRHPIGEEHWKADGEEKIAKMNGPWDGPIDQTFISMEFEQIP